MCFLPLTFPPANHLLSAFYIFFKFFLKSKVVPLEQIDFASEFQAIRQEKAEAELYEAQEEKQHANPWIARLSKVIHTI